MARKVMMTLCFRCGAEGARNTYAWVSHEDVCWTCVKEMEAAGWVVPDRGPTFLLTPSGALELPGHALVAECRLDGSPIYARWVTAGIAKDGDEATCPHCLGLSHLLS